ncbi:hypothetical protein H7564_002446 [Enterococcus faecalis]|nr:hypothetical protein [Enterococcus faecalis]
MCEDKYDHLDADYEEYLSRLHDDTRRKTMEFFKTVNILGTDYKIYKETTEADKPFMKGADGITDYTTKEIFISVLDDGDPNNFQKMEVYENRTIRHEIVHAILFESGLDHNADWPRNEEIVDWIAIQFPKLKNIFESINV